MKNRKQRKVLLYLLVVLGLTIGFALLSTTLKINGTASIKSNTWNIHWDDRSVSVSQGSVSATDPIVSTTKSTKDTVSFDVELELPGDYFEFSVDAVNEGSIDGALELAENFITYKSNNVETTLPDYMDFKVVYDDDTNPTTGDVLKASESQTYKIRVEFKSSVEELPENPEPITIEVNLPYVQHKETCASPVSFSSDSWDTVVCNVKKGNVSAYAVGDTKTIDMGTFGTHTIRVANKSTPNECEQTDFSETACGFVLEFEDIIVRHSYNPYEQNGEVNGDGNRGGWEYSDMRTYLNTDVYNSLPSVVKNTIKNTYVVSGYGSKDSVSFKTTDKLYLLSEKEVYNMSMINDLASTTRQLDYYSANNVNPSNVTGTIKQYQGSDFNWWLRTAYPGDWWSFMFVAYAGNYNRDTSNSPYDDGVSPAFRIG